MGGESGSRAPALQRKRVLSGMRPTGRLHIGHYFGALQNWVRLQNAVLPGAEMGRSSAAPPQMQEYECFFFVADWHALTSDYADTSAVAQNTIEITTDYLAAGIDPAKAVIFQQSLVPEHAELHLLLSMVTPLGWLERVPTYKEALDNIKDKELHTYGFLGYPTLQTADIVIYSQQGQALVVPVGEDQVSHVEFSREIVRRFLLYYGFTIDAEIFALKNRKTVYRVWRELLELPASGSPPEGEIPGEQRIIFCATMRQRVHEMGVANFFAKLSPEAKIFFAFRGVLEEPQVLLTKTPRIPGLDGRKMSKSYGNAITLSETDEEIRKKTKVMKTDPARQKRMDKGNPDVCPVYDWHKLFAVGEEGKKTLEWAAAGCRSAGIGCIECKSAMADNLIKWIEPVRTRRVEFERHPGLVLEIIDEGSKRARKVAQETMGRVREAVFGWERKKNEVRSNEITKQGRNEKGGI